MNSVATPPEAAAANTSVRQIKRWRSIDCSVPTMTRSRQATTVLADSVGPESTGAELSMVRSASPVGPSPVPSLGVTTTR